MGADIIPLVCNTVDELNGWLCAKYDGSLELEADLDRVPALAPRRDVVWEKIAHADFLSTEEKRKILKV